MRIFSLPFALALLLVLYRLRQGSRHPSVSNSPSTSTSESNDEHCGGDGRHCVATKSRGPLQALCVKRSSDRTGGGAAGSQPNAIKRTSTGSCLNRGRSAMKVNLPAPDAIMNKLRPRVTAKTCGAVDGSSSTGGKAQSPTGEASDSSSSSGQLRSFGAAARAARRRPPVEHCSSDGDGATSKSGSDAECPALRTGGSAAKRPRGDRSSSDGGGQVSAAAAAASGAGRNAKRRRLHVHERSSGASSSAGGGTGKEDSDDAAPSVTSDSTRTVVRVAQSSRLLTSTDGAVTDSVVNASRVLLPAQAPVVEKRKRTPSGPLRTISTAAGSDVAKGSSKRRKRVEVLQDDDALQRLVEEHARQCRLDELEHQRAQQAAREASKVRTAAALARIEQPAAKREAAGTGPHMRIIFTSSFPPPPPPCGGRNCLYAKLGLSCLTEGINCRMVKQAYHARMLVEHPDKAQGLGQKAGAAIAEPEVFAYNNLNGIVNARANNMEARANCANWRQNGRIPRV